MKQQHLQSRRYIRMCALKDIYAFTIKESAFSEIAIDSIKAAFDDYICIENKFNDKFTVYREFDIAAKDFISIVEKGLDVPLSSKKDFAKRAIMHAHEEYSKSIAQISSKIRHNMTLIEGGVLQIVVSMVFLLAEWQKLIPHYLPFIDDQNKKNFLHTLDKYDVLKTITLNDSFNVMLKKYGNIWDGDSVTINFLLKTLTIDHDTTISSDVNTYMEKFAANILLNIPDLYNILESKFYNIDDFFDFLPKSLSGLLHLFAKPKSQDIIIKETSIFYLFIDKKDFYFDLTTLFLSKSNDIDLIISDNLNNWSVDRLASIDKILAKLCIIEVLFLKTPKPIAINEYLEIGKIFGNPNTATFLNGVLHNAFQQHSPLSS